MNPEDFRPPWFLRSGHLQTLLTGFYKPKASLAAPIVHRLSIDPWGELLAYENTPVSTLAPRNDAVFLFHGLGSSHRGTYMTHLTDQLLQMGFRVFRFDLPGAGDSFEVTPLPPHGACAGLLWSGIQQLSERLAISNWRGVGVSLGGNLLLRMLIDHASELCDPNGTRVKIVKAIAVAPPIDLAACCEHMETGVNRIYAKYFLRSLKVQSKIRAARWPEWEARFRTADFRSIRRFDESVTAPLAGFPSANAYYEAGSTKPELSQIRTRTVVLLDAHDPIVPYRIFQDAKWSGSTTVRVTRRGGHVGYLHRKRNPGNPSRIERWADGWIAKELATDEQS
ncbi:putative hydrolase [Pirellula sp. SH-Sr6A]|uniref:YheT family hydrolase n=1 Tax=Pirellula sp. SH-Sr6A TaxID=1632865 RepID=UPI00078EF687|nr:alpha/beta fold hydrolase [Pirellula sp. SH-Sr6A]AMV31235.1 putative hydrolase [Pirellula sp. SH-Sr6A]